MKTISTYISPAVYLAMKDTTKREGVKIWQFIEQGIRLRIADYERRQRKADDFTVPYIDERPEAIHVMGGQPK